MEYTIKNDALEVTVATKAGALKAVRHLPTGADLLWEGDPAVWPGQAPVMFPHCGALVGDVLTAKGQTSPSPRHGFARLSDFSLAEQGGDFVRLRLVPNDEIRAIYPYDFQLDFIYTLNGDTLTHTVEVLNPAQSGEALPFNVGFHPGFAVTNGGEGWEIRFAQPESPLVIETDENGLVSGKIIRWGEAEAIPVTGDLFAKDSICFTGLQSKTVSLVQKGTGRAVKVGVEGFPYVLVWGQPKGPHRYVCIEPWHGVPDPTTPYGEFAKKPGITLLEPGETFTTSLPMKFTV